MCYGIPHTSQCVTWRHSERTSEFARIISPSWITCAASTIRRKRPLSNCCQCTLNKAERCLRRLKRLPLLFAPTACATYNKIPSRRASAHLHSQDNSSRHAAPSRGIVCQSFLPICHHLHQTSQQCDRHCPSLHAESTLILCKIDSGTSCILPYYI